MAYTNYAYLDATDNTGRVFPTDVKPSQIKVSISQPTLTTTTNALLTQRRTLGLHSIELTYTYPPMEADELQKFVAFFNAMQGSAKAFKLNAPKELINDSTHIADSVIKNVTTSYSAGDKEIIIDNCGTSLEPAIKGGNFIQFSDAGHDKIYVIVADANSIGDGTCKIRIEPGLHTGITASTNLNRFSDVIPIHAIFKNDTIKFDVNSALLYGFEVSFVEQWED